MTTFCNHVPITAALLASCLATSFAGAQTTIKAGTKPAANMAGPLGHADVRQSHPAKPKLAVYSQQFKLQQAAVPRVSLAALDSAALMAQDQQNNSKGPLRISVSRDLTIGLASGAWVAVPGGKLWRVDVQLDQAYGMRLHFLGFDLPIGAEVVVYSLDQPAQPASRFAGRGPLDSSEFWAPATAGPNARIEYFVPTDFLPDDPEKVPFVVDQAQHLYRDIFKTDDGGIAAAGSCNLLPVCYAAWTNMRKAVGLIDFVSGGGGFVCSGTLVTTTSNDQTPYYLTARHCISTVAEANSANITWKYESTTCSPVNVNPGTTSSFCTLVSSIASCDETLLLLEGALPTDMFWAGWVTTAQPTNVASTCLHHPSGDYMRISFCNQFSNANCSTGGGPLTNWCRADWTSGITEGGSSGSGLFRNDTQQLYATLTCGSSSCANPGGDDSYGRFAVAYSASGGFSSPLAGGSDDAFEPNNTCATAIAMGNGTFNNLIVKNPSEDWFKITIPGGSAVSISLSFTNSNGDIDAQLYNACGGAIVASSLSNTNAETINYTNSGATADFYLRVFLDTDTRNTYNMTIAATAPSNNLCSSAILVVAGNVPFSNIGATTDGPDEPSGCNFGGYTQIGNDVWFKYLAQCTGTTTVSLCGCNYDAKLAVYTTCPASPNLAIGCSDNFCGNAPQVTFNCTSGTVYRFRIGGFNGATGSGTMNIVCNVPTPTGACCLTNGSCSNGQTQSACQAGGGTYKGDNSTCAGVTCAPPCPADVNGSGTVNIDDLLAVINAWGACAGCPADVNGNGQVNIDDLLAVINAWGPCP